MKRTVSVTKTVLLMILAAAVASCATFAALRVFSPFDLKYREIVRLMEKNFLYDFDESELEDGAYSGAVAALGDDYSYYYDPQAASNKKQSEAGKTVALGVTLARHPDTGALTVIYVNSHSAANSAGIKKGDIISAINGEPTDGLDVGKCAEMIVKEEGAQCTLDIMRGSEHHTVSTQLFEIVEDSVKYRLLGEIGYIGISDFNSSTPDQFSAAADALREQAVSGLIIDLRDNLGGLTEALCKTLDIILPEADVVRAKFKDGSIKVTERTSGDGWDIPIAVITNGYTASSSELFALAVRDNGGVLIGEKTYGKGVMQTTYTLSDGSAVKLTVAELVDKNGATYNKIGITPDIKVSQSEYAKKYAAFLTDNEDTQLQAAVKYLTEEKLS